MTASYNKNETTTYTTSSSHVFTLGAGSDRMILALVHNATRTGYMAHNFSIGSDVFQPIGNLYPNEMYSLYYLTEPGGGWGATETINFSSINAGSVSGGEIIFIQFDDVYANEPFEENRLLWTASNQTASTLNIRTYGPDILVTHIAGLDTSAGGITIDGTMTAHIDSTISGDLVVVGTKTQASPGVTTNVEATIDGGGSDQWFAWTLGIRDSSGVSSGTAGLTGTEDIFLLKNKLRAYDIA